MERTLRLPPAFRERLALQLGEQDCARVLTALGAPCVHVLRVNLRLATPQAVHAELEAAGFELEPAPAPFDDAFVLVGGRLRDLQATEAVAWSQPSAATSARCSCGPRSWRNTRPSAWN